MFAVSTYTPSSQTLYIALVSFSTVSQPVNIQINGVSTITTQATANILTSANPADQNTITDPDVVVPKTQQISASKQFTYTLAPYSVNILVINAH